MTMITDTEMQSASERLGQDKTCLLVDDDRPFVQRLAKALLSRGLIVSVACSVQDALDIVTFNPPRYAVIDLNIEGETGLQIVEALAEERADSQSIVLTGYGNLPNAVAAVKTGAQLLLPKPATIDEILAALIDGEAHSKEQPNALPSGDVVRLAHIHSMFRQFDQNVSETARQLNMHRRTLQRILAKSPLPDETTLLLENGHHADA